MLPFLDRSTVLGERQTVQILEHDRDSLLWSADKSCPRMRVELSEKVRSSTVGLWHVKLVKPRVQQVVENHENHFKFSLEFQIRSLYDIWCIYDALQYCMHYALLCFDKTKLSLTRIYS